MAEQPDKAEFENLQRLLEMARDEDLGDGDITSAMLPDDVQAEAMFVARQPLVLCGGAMIEAIATCYDADIRTTVLKAEGETLQSGDVPASWSGPAKAILTAERVALNFLQHLCGIATTTRRYVDAVAETGAKIYDTRKTTPGWRQLEKYAVRAGGGCNHRKGLYDAILVKDNHLAVLARCGAAKPLDVIATELQRVRGRLGAEAFIELEVDTLDQFVAALAMPVDIILLDNMTAEQMRQAVKLRDEAGLAETVQLEASGGITLESVREAAETGVDRIAVGAITHSAAAVDIGLDIEIK